ncbi:hypothetical protein MKX01_036123 [Papaver californicum]|nr:hypothetical protein MKX01_036123 [Papaver californicum]
MRELTIENLRGSTIKIALWGYAANQNYQGKITLSSTNVTKVYTDIDMPEIVAMRESVLYAGSLMLDHGDILRSRLRKANHQSIFSICQMGSVMSGCYCQHVQGHRHQCDA